MVTTLFGTKTFVHADSAFALRAERRFTDFADFLARVGERVATSQRGVVQTQLRSTASRISY